MTSVRAFDYRHIRQALTGALAALVLLGSVVAYNHQYRTANGYVADRPYTAKILAIVETKASLLWGPRFVKISGVNGQKIFLQDPDDKFSHCNVGDVIEYRLDRHGRPGNLRFIYSPASCRTQ